MTVPPVDTVRPPNVTCWQRFGPSFGLCHWQKDATRQLCDHYIVAATTQHLQPAYIKTLSLASCLQQLLVTYSAKESRTLDFVSVAAACFRAFTSLCVPKTLGGSGVLLLLSNLLHCCSNVNTHPSTIKLKGPWGRQALKSDAKHKAATHALLATQCMIADHSFRWHLQTDTGVQYHGWQQHHQLLRVTPAWQV